MYKSVISKMFRNESPEPTEDPLNVNRKPIKPEVIIPVRDSDPGTFYPNRSGSFEDRST